jgi:hypothetical protein
MIGPVSRISLAVFLAAVSVFLLVRPFLGDIEAAKKESFITDVVEKGPVVVEDLEWTLESLRAYTQLVDKDKRPIELDVPGGAVIVLAEFSIRPIEKTRIDDGVFCNAELRDDQGNTWGPTDAFSLPIPTFCGDDDLEIERGKAFKVAKVFVVPEKSVPHLVGVIVPPLDNTASEQRVLIRP